ncbi:hypothetical protein thsps117_40590 [Pseudomonas sp. No.117]
MVIEVALRYFNKCFCDDRKGAGTWDAPAMPRAAPRSQWAGVGVAYLPFWQNKHSAIGLGGIRGGIRWLIFLANY